MRLGWLYHTSATQTPQPSRTWPQFNARGSKGGIFAVATMLFTLTIYGAAPAQAVECKEVYRTVEFCPEALRGVDSVASDEKNRMLVSIQSQNFTVSTSFFDGEGIAGVSVD